MGVGNSHAKLMKRWDGILQISKFRLIIYKSDSCNDGQMTEALLHHWKMFKLRLRGFGRYFCWSLAEMPCLFWKLPFLSYIWHKNQSRMRCSKTSGSSITVQGDKLVAESHFCCYLHTMGYSEILFKCCLVWSYCLFSLQSVSIIFWNLFWKSDYKRQ